MVYVWVSVPVPLECLLDNQINFKKKKKNKTRLPGVESGVFMFPLIQVFGGRGR